MMHGTYCGALEHLKGLTALLQEVPGSDNVKAQFDDYDATRDGKELAFGWHLFRRSEFKDTRRIGDVPKDEVA